MTEQNEQGLSKDAVQTPQKGAKKPKKKRSQSDKVGTHKYNQQLLKRAIFLLEKVLDQQRWARVEMSKVIEARYSRLDVEGHTEQDEVDKEIIQRLLEVGVNGALPKDIAAEVNKRRAYNLEYYEVSRRLVRLNKKMHFETGKTLFEKHGHRWAMNRFGFESYGAIDSEDPKTVDSFVFDSEVKE